MTWTTRLSEDQRTVQIWCIGKLAVDDLTMLAIEVSYLAREHGHTKVLIDLSETDLSFPAFHLSVLLDIYAEHHLPQGMTTGIVLGLKNASRNLSALQSAGKDYGYPVEILTAEQTKAWLAQTK